MNTRDPVVICGGGVIGCAIAYELSLRDIPVVVVEAEHVAYGASGTAAGLLSPPSLEDMASPLGPLLRVSFDRHLELAQRLPAQAAPTQASPARASPDQPKPDQPRNDYGFARHPLLRLARSEDQERHLRAELQQRHAAGLPAQWLDPAAVAALLPWLDIARPDGLADGVADAAPIRGALRGEDAAQIEPDRFTQALLDAACARGAELRMGRVSGILRNGEHVTGVLLAPAGGPGETDGERLPARSVVIAMGPWSAQAAAWLGTPVPVEPLKGQILRLDPGRELPLAGFIDADDNYAAVKASGLVYIGTTEESVGFDLIATTEAHDSIRTFAARHSALLAQAPLVKHTACLRPLSVDALPIIGPVPGLPNAFLATGHGRKGLMLAPATGLALADLITGEYDAETQSPVIDLQPFAPGRFAPAGRLPASSRTNTI